MRDLKNTPYGKFIWFVGVVEDTFSDPTQLGRVRVRAIGFHPSDEILKTENLPLAPVLNGGSARINAGQMVLGFFMDGELLQQPFILGVINGGVSSAVSPFSSNRFEGSVNGIGAPADVIGDTRPVDGSCPQIQKGLCNSAAAWNNYHEIKDKNCLMDLFKSQIKVNWDPSKENPPNGGPWCGVFVASILASQGYPYPPAYTLARSFASPKYNTKNKNGYVFSVDCNLDSSHYETSDSPSVLYCEVFSNIINSFDRKIKRNETSSYRNNRNDTFGVKKIIKYDLFVAYLIRYEYFFIEIKV
jgi:hypothetical protein